MEFLVVRKLYNWKCTERSPEWKVVRRRCSDSCWKETLFRLEWFNKALNYVHTSKECTNFQPAIVFCVFKDFSKFSVRDWSIRKIAANGANFASSYVTRSGKENGKWKGKRRKGRKKARDFATCTFTHTPRPVSSFNINNGWGSKEKIVKSLVSDRLGPGLAFGLENDSSPVGSRTRFTHYESWN